MPQSLIHDKAKEAAAHFAADLIQDGMLIGLGSGTTSAFFIKRLIQRCHEGLKIKVVATSSVSEHLAKEGRIPFADIDTVTHLDLAIDGADEIDKKKQMIKGGGGALLREKIIAKMAREMIVIVDESKCVDQIGAFPLPVEIAPFAYQATLAHLEALGLHPKLRLCHLESTFLTDNGNYIADLHINHPIPDPENLDYKLKAIPGVLATGLFLNLASRVVVGERSGKVTVLR